MVFLGVGLWHLFAYVHSGLTVRLCFETILNLDVPIVARFFQLGKATENRACTMNHACFLMRAPLTRVWDRVRYTSVPFGNMAMDIPNRPRC